MVYASIEETRQRRHPEGLQRRHHQVVPGQHHGAGHRRDPDRNWCLLCLDLVDRGDVK